MFGNMGGASAFIAGGLVPLATFAAPQPSTTDSPLVTRLKRAHAIVSSCSMVSLLISVMFSTMSSNKLRETVVSSTVSLKALLVEGEFALPWLGCNAHFVFGLCGFAATVGLNAWLTYGGAVGRAVSCLVASALLLMLSVVNDAVSTKMGEVSVGSTVLNLFSRYAALLLRSMVAGRRVLVLGAVTFAALGIALAAKALCDGCDGAE